MCLWKGNFVSSGSTIWYLNMCKCVLCACLLNEGEWGGERGLCVWFQPFMSVLQGVCTVVQFWPQGHFERLCPEWGLSSSSLCFDSSHRCSHAHANTHARSEACMQQLFTPAAFDHQLSTPSEDVWIPPHASTPNPQPLINPLHLLMSRLLTALWKLSTFW